jgi:citrate lyase subunit beta/citryl-CoA lyase
MALLAARKYWQLHPMLAFDKIRRSWLLVPVLQPERLAAAPSAGADVIVLDLSEFVAEADKPGARDSVAQNLDTAKTGGAEVFVQVDPEVLLADLSASVWPGLDGVVVSRAETASQITRADEIISALESQRGMLPGSVELVVSLETAFGNHNGFEIATASPRIWGLTLGRADLVMDLRPEPSGEIHLMQYLMQRLVILASATGKVPLGAWWRFPDRGSLATPGDTLAAARRGRAIGFKGSFCVLDDQVECLNDGFTPSEAELEAAQELCRYYSEATVSGTTSVAVIDGRVLTADIVRQYTNTLTLAEACATRDLFKTAAAEGRPIPLP